MNHASLYFFDTSLRSAWFGSAVSNGLAASQRLRLVSHRRLHLNGAVSYFLPKELF